VTKPRVYDLTPDAFDIALNDGVGQAPMSTYGATGRPAAACAGACMAMVPPTRRAAVVARMRNRARAMFVPSSGKALMNNYK